MIEARLSEPELAQYREKGWIVPRWELPQQLIAEMRDEYAALLERNSGIKSDIILAPHQTKGGSMGVIGSEKWLNFATHPGLVAIARQLIGDDIILWGMPKSAVSLHTLVAALRSICSASLAAVQETAAP